MIKPHSIGIHVAHFLLTLVFTCCISDVAAIASAADLPASQGPALRVGSEVECPPFAFVDKAGKPAGFSVDLIRAVADAMNMPITFTVGSWDSLWEGLTSGTLDVLPIVAITPERRRVVDFSLPHTENFDAFFVRAGRPSIADIEAAGGKEIVVMRSDAAQHVLAARNFQGKLVLVDTIPEGLALVASGKHDAFLGPKLISSLALQEHGIKGLVAGPVIPDYKRVFAFGVRKGADELREKLNEGLMIVKSNGEYQKIYEKWLSIGDPWLKYRKAVFLAILVVVAVALGALTWTLLLRQAVKRRTTELDAKNAELEKEIIARREAEDATRVRNAILQAINRIFQQALTCATEEELGKLCLAVAEDLTQSKFGFIGEIGSDGMLHDIAISDSGWDLCAIVDQTGDRGPAGRFKLHGLYGRTLQDGKSVLCNDPPPHPDSLGTPEGRPPLEAFLGTPLIDSNKTIGMIAMGNRQGGYTQVQQEILEAIAPAIVRAFSEKQAQINLLRIMREQRTILDTANVAISLVRNRKQVWINRKMEEMFQYPREELVDQTTRKLYPSQEAYERLGREAYPVLARGLTYETLQVLVRRDGSHIWVKYNGKAIDPPDLSFGTLWILEDITEHKEMEEALRRSYEELEHRVADRTKELTLANEALRKEIAERGRAEEALQNSLAEKVVLLREVHHRVKNNLQIVSSLLGLQLLRCKDQQVVDALRDTHNRVAAMALLHEKLYRSTNLAFIDFSIYLKDLCGQLLRASVPKAKPVTILQRVAPIGLPLEQAVPCALIVSELVSNALKHGFPDNRTGTVAVGLELIHERNLVLTVQDDGIGLPPNFDPKSTSTLGLKIVSRLANQLDGQFEAGPSDRVGAVFRVTFPLPGNSRLGEQP